MNWILHKKNEIEPYLEYYPRNDSYLIRGVDGRYFDINGEPEVYRRWGRSHIYVGFSGESIIRMEPHIIPCVQHISDYGRNSVCNGLGRIALHRLVGECWLDDFTADAVVCRKKEGIFQPNAANNLYLNPTHRTVDPLVRDPMDFDCLSGQIEVV